MTTHEETRSAQPAREARDQVPLHATSARRTSVQTALQRYLAGELAITGQRLRKNRTSKETKETKG